MEKCRIKLWHYFKESHGRGQSELCRSVSVLTYLGEGILMKGGRIIGIFLKFGFKKKNNPASIYFGVQHKNRSSA